VIVDPVTLRWAGALYNLAERQNALAAVRADVEKLGVEVARPEIEKMIFNPRLERTARRAKLAPSLAGMHALTRNFVELAFEKRREDVLRTVAEAFKRRTNEDLGQVEGVVESARPLAQAEIDKLGAELGQRLGKKLKLENRIVPELVGGARVIAANRMIDYSVQGRLEALRRKLLEAPLPATRGA
jgi:F-type H+-transporting ATPase subunit delta